MAKSKVRRMTLQEWVKALEAGEPVNGDSPGGVAAELGLSRQAVHSLINTGRLDAIRVERVIGRRRELAAIVILPESVKVEKALRSLPNQKRFG